jgi:hypothetical protein
MTYILEYDVPLPKLRRLQRPNGELRNVIAAMPVGASFVVPDKHERMRALVAAKREQQARPEVQYVSRQTDDGCYRVWRVA